MLAIAQFRSALAVEQEMAGFRRDVAGWVVSVLNLLAALNSTAVFLGLLKVGVVGWLMMNTCAPTIYLFVLGFLFRSLVVMVAAAVPMSYYGTGGLFIFGWSGYDIPAQIGHILMTVGVVYTMSWIVRHRQWRTLALGVALGAAVLVSLMLIQAQWFSAHPEMMEMLFSGDWEVPGR